MKRSTYEPARTHKKHKLLAPQRHKRGLPCPEDNRSTRCGSGRSFAATLAKVEQQKVELEEASRQQEVMVKELNDSRILLGDIQHQLKDVWTRSQVMEDDLLKSVRAVETLKSEMPPQIIEDYKKSPEFNMGL
ncbi:hypothetical protein B296_00055649 [Ensete ventricosum]|uniref:Uncharacterized protein n=1 Tax=Ensete ventricosum TaxID=4639 RepID=A0A426XYQ8_ENSVE|nr:hypothetical protein B296_00055649 [Ensete ventricosum]